MNEVFISAYPSDHASTRCEAVQVQQCLCMPQTCPAALGQRNKAERIVLSTGACRQGRLFLFLLQEKAKKQDARVAGTSYCKCLLPQQAHAVLCATAHTTVWHVLAASTRSCFRHQIPQQDPASGIKYLSSAQHPRTPRLTLRASCPEKKGKRDGPVTVRQGRVSPGIDS